MSALDRVTAIIRRSPTRSFFILLSALLLLAPTLHYLHDDGTPSISRAAWSSESMSDAPVGVIMPKLGNATAKAELGRASWRLLHTMAARFPEKPSQPEKDALKNFLYLFSSLYPCGECAAEFQELLKKHPPQVGSRSSASMYLCFLHNRVNERLGKEEFDCSSGLEGIYDCGCAEDEAKVDPVTGHKLEAG